MTSAPATPLVRVEDYLGSTWRPDREYIDGVLVERIVPTIAHALLQAILIRFFTQLEESFRFVVLPEVRTRIVERSKYRIPDVMLCPLPLPQGKVVDVVPLAVIEVLSPEDAMSEAMARFHDYESIGSGPLVLMDPERFLAYRFEKGSLMQAKLKTLVLPDGRELPFESEKLFEQLRQYQQRQP